MYIATSRSASLLAFEPVLAYVDHVDTVFVLISIGFSTSWMLYAAFSVGFRVWGADTEAKPPCAIMAPASTFQLQGLKHQTRASSSENFGKPSSCASSARLP